MKLESLTMEVRPRSAWESMDLAVRLVMNHWRVLLSSWMVTVLPLFIIISIMLLEDYPYWAFFFVWFFKPLYDRVPLFVLSRVIFAEKTSWRDVLNAVPSFFKTGVFSSLTLYRLDPGRSFGLPVRQLEGLKGKRRRLRMRALKRGVSNREVIFFILCFHLEALISWGVLGFVLMMLPAHMVVDSAETLIMGSEPGLLINIISMLLYFVIMMIVETLYVAGGFVLYLNRRIILEGWDIELVFRRLAQRHEKEQQKARTLAQSSALPSILFVTVVMSLVALVSSADVQAGSESKASTYEEVLPEISYPPLAAEESGKVIREVMAQPVFSKTKVIEYLKYIGPEDENKETDVKQARTWLTDTFELIGNVIAFIFEAGLWILLLITLYLLIKYRERLSLGFFRKQKIVVQDTPDVLFGLDIREESLPDDVSAEALNLFQQQNYRAALALLYRATLAYLVRSFDFTLEPGATEGDCLKLVTQELPLKSEGQVEYFIELTKAWQITAYAHRQIPAEKMQQLCLKWAEFYGPKVQMTEGNNI